jgi:hypothetical protein
MPGREIKPGGTSVLPLAMGPMPDTEIVYLDVIQTRSDGSTETWAGVDVPAAGAQHPAFAFKLAPLEPGQVPGQGHGDAGASDQVQTDATAEEPDSAEGSGTVRLVAVLLLIVAVTGFALFWQRRRGAQSADGDGAESADDAASAARVAARSQAPSVEAGQVEAGQVEAGQVEAGQVETRVAETARVRRRSVVRATAKPAADRRATARKPSGDAATATIPRRRGNASGRAGNIGSDNA